MCAVRMFMCCHREFSIVPPLWKPLQCGSALNAPIPGAMRDDAGDNISVKNREYCELTAHYFAWKNITAEHYGFCHYRRFFCADDSVKRPYLALGAVTNPALLGSKDYWQRLALEYPLILPRSEDMGLKVREHYCTSRYHYSADLELFTQILAEKTPQMSASAEEYLSQRRQYFCNMFIMDREHFLEYCSVLFPVLEEFDRRKTLHGDFQSDRTDGYLGEIFTGIYVTHCRKGGVKIKELPRLDISCTPGKRVACAVLPPESKRRFFAKKIAKKIRG